MSKDVGIISNFIGLVYTFAATYTPNKDGDCILVTLKANGKDGYYRALMSTSTTLATSILTSLPEYQAWQIFAYYADAKRFTGRLKCCDKESRTRLYAK